MKSKKKTFAETSLYVTLYIYIVYMHVYIFVYINLISLIIFTGIGCQLSLSLYAKLG